MKKIILFILVTVMLISSAVGVSADSGKAYNWYCMRKAGHLQPSCDPSMSFIENYGGYYVDKAHGDDSPDKVVYLTFDAGYENGNVSKILDILKLEKVSGAFFILAHLVKDNTDLVIRMADEGHLVCNHTSRHKDMTGFRSFDDFKAELESLETLYREKTGKELENYYRPPEGRFSEENLQFAERMGYKTIFWSFAYADWDNDHQMSAESAEKKILDNVHNGAVILLHPTSATNVAVLGKVIRSLKAAGYRFGTLDELTRKR